MKCLILAAGYATRLYPFTKNTPKALLKVGEKTVLDWLVDDVAASQAVEEFILVSNHRFAGHFRLWANTKSQRITVVDDGSSTNETRLGAVKDLQFAMEALSLREELFVMAGDNLTDFSLGTFLAYAKSKQASCVMRYYEADEERRKRSGVLEMRGDRVIAMEEKPPKPKSPWCCPPFYYFTAQDAALVGQAITEGCNTDAPGSFLSWLCRKSPVYAMEMPGKRYDIGSPESYRAVQALFS